MRLLAEVELWTDKGKLVASIIIATTAATAATTTTASALVGLTNKPPSCGKETTTKLSVFYLLSKRM